MSHEFWFQFPSPRAPIGFWIPGYDTTCSADQWYEQSWSSVQLNLDEGTVLDFICRCLSPRHPFTLIFLLHLLGAVQVCFLSLCLATPSQSGRMTAEVILEGSLAICLLCT